MPINKNDQYFLLDVFLEDIKKMTSNTFVSAGLTSIGALFGAGAVSLFATNFWYSVVCVVVCFACFLGYEYLP